MATNRELEKRVELLEQGLSRHDELISSIKESLDDIAQNTSEMVEIFRWMKQTSQMLGRLEKFLKPFLWLLSLLSVTFFAYWGMK